MSEYDFEKRFVPLIRSGEKRQTIRTERTQPTKPGDQLDFYTCSRSGERELIFTTICKSVLSIEINIEYIKVNNIILDKKELTDFVRSDGFNSLDEFYNYFRKVGKLIKEPLTNMVVIIW